MNKLPMPGDAEAAVVTEELSGLDVAKQEYVLHDISPKMVAICSAHEAATEHTGTCEWAVLRERLHRIGRLLEPHIGPRRPSLPELPDTAIDRRRDSLKTQAAGLTADGEAAYPASPVGGMTQAMEREQRGETHE